MAVYDNLKQAHPQDGFTIGITDDVTNKSLPEGDLFDLKWLNTMP
jgi:pyruvate-ferredoxin/flavodoxin oxidoreductase